MVLLPGKMMSVHRSAHFVGRWTALGESNNFDNMVRWGRHSNLSGALPTGSTAENGDCGKWILWIKLEDCRIHE